MLQLELAAEAVCLAVAVDCSCDESANDNDKNDASDPAESLFPDLVAEAHCLECAPETVVKVESESYEPYDLDCNHPPVLECCVEENVRILSVLAHELLELHVSPEMVEVECYETENHDTEEKHVL